VPSFAQACFQVTLFDGSPIDLDLSVDRFQLVGRRSKRWRRPSRAAG
jgi:hypothetical protein